MSHDTTNFCMLCEQHSREAQAARAEVRALKEELLRCLPIVLAAAKDAVRQSEAQRLPAGAAEQTANETPARIQQLESELGGGS